MGEWEILLDIHKSTSLIHFDDLIEFVNGQHVMIHSEILGLPGFPYLAISEGKRQHSHHVSATILKLETSQGG